MAESGPSSDKLLGKDGLENSKQNLEAYPVSRGRMLIKKTEESTEAQEMENAIVAGDGD